MLDGGCTYFGNKKRSSVAKVAQIMAWPIQYEIVENEYL